MKAQLALFRKNLTRFWPLWGLCIVALFLVNIFKPYEANYKMALPVFVYAGVCALVLFGDLFNKERCNALHAMPISRFSIFSVQTVTGLLFFLVPFCVAYLSVSLLFGIGHRWLMVLGALGASSLVFVGFFGFAVLCVMLAGNRVGAAMIFFAGSFLNMAFEDMLSLFYKPFLGGVPLDVGQASLLFQQMPGYYPVIACTLPYKEDYIWNGDWLPYLICAGVGVLAAVLAWVLYRFRKLERTGQFSTVPGLRYVFTALCSILAGMLLFGFLGHSGAQYYFLFLYIPVFYFAFAMLADKRFFVFRPGHLLTLGLVLTVFGGSLLLVRYDIPGIASYVPGSDRVRSVEVYVNMDQEPSRTGNYRSVYYHDRYFGEAGNVITAQEDIAMVTQLHRSLLEGAADVGEGSMVYLTYTLKSGIKVRRYYPMLPEGDRWETLCDAVSTRTALFGDVQWDTYVSQVYSIRVSRTQGNKREILFGEAAETEAPAYNVARIRKRSMLERFLNKVGDACDEGKLDQLERDEYVVTVQSRDGQGKEKTVRFYIPNTGYRPMEYLSTCWNNASRHPDNTLTEEMTLTEYS